MSQNALNVLGAALVPCSYDPLTGYYRDGCCNTDDHDRGSHVVCEKSRKNFWIFHWLGATTSSRHDPNTAFLACKLATAGACAPCAGKKPWNQALHRLLFWNAHMNGHFCL